LIAEPPSTPPGTIVGISLGVGIPVIIFIIFIMHKNGKLKEMKQRWDRFKADTRRRLADSRRRWGARLRSLNPRNNVHHRPSTVYVKLLSFDK